ncbi:MAG: hypothetical protein U0359_26815 [Byssovorax sp.]
MVDQDEPTLDAPNAHAVLVIACPSAIAVACQRAVDPLGAIVHHVEAVRDAATLAARVRPLVLVMPESVYDFDEKEFEHLARDVGGVVMTLPDAGLTKSELRSRLLGHMHEATRRRA